MSDPATLPTVPSFTTSLLHSLAQKGGTMVATAFLAAGWIPNSEFDQDKSVVTGAIVMAGSIAWTVVRDWLAKRRADELAAKAAAK